MVLADRKPPRWFQNNVFAGMAPTGFGDQDVMGAYKNGAGVLTLRPPPISQ